MIKSCKEPIDKSIIIDNHILFDIDCIGQSKEIDGCFISLLALSILSIYHIIDFMIVIAFEVQNPLGLVWKTCEQLPIGVILWF